MGLILLLMSPFMTDVQAQDEPEEGRTSAPPRGAWALQFGIAENFRLDSFQGATVSAKKSLSETRAFRFGTTLEARFAFEEGDDERDTNLQRLSATAQWLAYTEGDAERAGTVRFYFGAGPLAGIDRSFYAINREDAEGETLEDEQTSVRWNVGAAGVLGAEWTVHRRIGLLAEYGTSLFYNRETRTLTVSEEERRTTQNGFGLGSGGVRFGVAVYL